MKQKYTVTIAGNELNLISDATSEEVEALVNSVDRRMRDITLKSPRCQKSEAAILCALSFCSEQAAMQQSFKKLERDSFRAAAEIERLKKTVETLQKEKDRLQAESDRLRDAVPVSEVCKPEPAPAPDAPVKKDEKSKVGGMFGLLTYSDV